ncbi:hypothetical protein C440_09012 [Haloferax mucosum ATCC BAA-1512]|uniref:Uncharacterized protein n=1 Tax=Haloferax mucosum ATCC BAA-1512 TaxID=662479 RepID=M0IEK4_9EURY|nr:hypothetical protein [Haloferax mucosum]ELZ95205.1 hypothetical protein C440_09012 [Haloferax mucosum ATCC BAA-1512]
MPAFDSALRQVGDFVVVAFLFFGLLPVFGPLDALVPLFGFDSPAWLGFVLAGAVGFVLLWNRPLRLRLVVRVWLVGLVTTLTYVTLFALLSLRENALGIAIVWLLGVGLGVVSAYPPLWRRAESRLRVE